MAEVNLVKSIYTGTDVTSLGEVAPSDTIADIALKEITETKAADSSAATYTVDLTDGTIFNLTLATAQAIIMPLEEAGKAFTIIVKTAPSSWAHPAGGYDIKWASATVPVAETISIYSFISDGSCWYGMEAGNGFAVPA